MKIIRDGIIEGTIEKFADQYDLMMEIHINRCSGDHFAHFQGSEFRGKESRLNTRGRGKTDREAIDDYARQISGKILILSNRVEIDVWRLI